MLQCQHIDNFLMQVTAASPHLKLKWIELSCDKVVYITISVQSRYSMNRPLVLLFGNFASSEKISENNNLIISDFTKWPRKRWCPFIFVQIHQFHYQNCHKYKIRSAITAVWESILLGCETSLLKKSKCGFFVRTINLSELGYR